MKKKIITILSVISLLVAVIPAVESIYLQKLPSTDLCVSTSSDAYVHKPCRQNPTTVKNTPKVSSSDAANGEGSFQTRTYNDSYSSQSYLTGQRENHPPFIPANPIPENGSIDQPILIYFIWIGGDPDPGDLVTYDVYFGSSSQPPKIVNNQTFPSFIPGILPYNTTYYWRIVAWDNQGAWSTGPLWHFTTIRDTTPPSTTHLFTGILGKNGWYVSSVTITLSTTETQSGVNHTYYAFDDENWTEYTNPFVISADGIHILEYYSIDNAGNIELIQGPFTCTIDQTRPSIILSRQPISPVEVKFTADVSDATSGIDYVWFALDDVLQFNDTQPPYEWTWTGIGSHTTTAIVYDIAGNAASQSMSTPVNLINDKKSVQIPRASHGFDPYLLG
jgi:hypothetical protein